MTPLYSVLRTFVGIIAVLIFFAGVILTILGGYEMFEVLISIVDYEHHKLAVETGLGLLSAVDLFLIAIVFFVFALGLVIIFSVGHPLESKIPEWLRLKNFSQLKVLLWEAILTTLVIAFLNTLAQKKIAATELVLSDLVIPSGIFMIALSIFFLKKGEH